jgi:hypothetical protein
MKTKAALLTMLVSILIAGCGATKSSFIPLKQEQLNGVYKIYHGNYASSGSEIADKPYINYICKNNNTCIDNYKKSTQQVIYVQVIENKYCKALSTTTEENEISAIERLQKEQQYKCDFSNNELRHTVHHKSGAALLGFKQNRNGDFINSELLTFQNGKIVDRKANFADEKTELYDQNGNKLTDKAYRKVVFDACDKIAVAEGFNYSTLSIKATANKTIVSNNAAQHIDKSVEELTKSKFYLENKNSSKIELFPPFGYIIKFANMIYYLYDKDGNLMFDDLSGAIKINENRFIAQSVKNHEKREVETFLYDADNKKVLFTADYMEPSNSLAIRDKYDLIVVRKNGQSGLIDFDGNIVVDYQSKYTLYRSYRGVVVDYDRRLGAYQKRLFDLELKPIIDKFYEVDFQDNLFAVYQKDRIVVFDYSKKILFDLEADNIKFYDKFFIAEFKGKSTLYNYNGDKLYDKTYNDLRSIDNGLFSYTTNGKTALMDINAKEIIPPVCDKITLNSCNIIECVTN